MKLIVEIKFDNPDDEARMSKLLDDRDILHDLSTDMGYLFYDLDATSHFPGIVISKYPKTVKTP